jgi:hypothetical protein
MPAAWSSRTDHGPTSPPRPSPDWLAVLAAAQPPARRATAAGVAERTLVLAVLRGALLDLLATGDVERTSAAVQLQLATLRRSEPSGRGRGGKP